MASTAYGRHVASEHLEIAGLRYDVTAYRVANRYYASWVCITCPARGETSAQASADAALQAGEDAFELHHVNHHGENL